VATEPPPSQYVGAEHVIDQMATFGHDRIHRLNPWRVFVLAILAGGFITIGGLFSVLLGAGVEPEGLQRLVEGFAFSAGFFFVVLSEAVLFTEANVVMPATLLSSKGAAGRVARFWAIAWVGNLAGALVVAQLVAAAQTYPGPVMELLGELVEAKLAYSREGTAAAWGQVVLSGVLANWLVGMAAFFAMMGRTILGKYVPVLLAVTVFVAANFQHSPANMGYFALWMAETGQGPGWATAMGWNIIPAGIGNMIGASLLVAAPFWYVFRPTLDAEVDTEARTGDS
jgi:formate transporter